MDKYMIIEVKTSFTGDIDTLVKGYQKEDVVLLVESAAPVPRRGAVLLDARYSENEMIIKIGGEGEQGAVYTYRPYFEDIRLFLNAAYYRALYIETAAGELVEVTLDDDMATDLEHAVMGAYLASIAFGSLSATGTHD